MSRNQQGMGIDKIMVSTVNGLQLWPVRSRVFGRFVVVQEPGTKTYNVSHTITGLRACSFVRLADASKAARALSELPDFDLATIKPGVKRQYQRLIAKLKNEAP